MSRAQVAIPRRIEVGTGAAHQQIAEAHLGLALERSRETQLMSRTQRRARDAFEVLLVKVLHLGAQAVRASTLCHGTRLCPFSGSRNFHAHLGSDLP